MSAPPHHRSTSSTVAPSLTSVLRRIRNWVVPVTFDGNVQNWSWRTSALTETPELLRGIREDPDHFFLCGVGPGHPRWESADTPSASYQDTRDLFEWAERLRAAQVDDPGAPIVLTRTSLGVPAGSTGNIPLRVLPSHDAVGLTSASSTAIFAVRVGERQGITTVQDLWRLAMPGRPLEDMEQHTEQFVSALRDMRDTAGLHRYALGCSSRSGPDVTLLAVEPSPFARAGSRRW